MPMPLLSQLFCAAAVVCCLLLLLLAALAVDVDRWAKHCWLRDKVCCRLNVRAAVLKL